MQIEGKDVTLMKAKGLSLVECGHLICLQRGWEGIPNNFLYNLDAVEDNLFAKGLVDEDGKFTDEGKKVYSSLTGERFNVPPVEEWAKEFRQKWSSDALGVSGKMGSSLALTDKLKRFVKMFPQYDVATIMAAADKYIEQERMNGGNFQYLQRADYFVFKDDKHKTTGSRLEEYCEIVSQEPTTNEEVYRRI